jgi:hypothetical protein
MSPIPFFLLYQLISISQSIPLLDEKKTSLTLSHLLDQMSSIKQNHSDLKFSLVKKERPHVTILKFAHGSKALIVSFLVYGLILVSFCVDHQSIRDLPA